MLRVDDLAHIAKRKVWMYKKSSVTQKINLSLILY